MSRAGEGDGAGLRPSPDATEPAPADAADTQLLPTVKRVPAVRRSHDEPTVRAVARRAAAALPALGRDGGVEQVPSSARATVDRRRRAAAQAAGLDPDALTDPDHDEAPTDPDFDEASDAAAAEPPSAILDDSGRPSDTDHPRSTEAADEGEPVAERADQSAEGSTDDPAEGSTDDAAEVSGDESAERSGDEPVDESGDDSGERAGDDDGGVRDAHRPTTTDERRRVEPTPVTRPAVPSPRTGGAPGTKRDAGRHAEAYHGRRRAQPTRVWRWVIAALVVLGLAGAVGLPYLLRSSAQPVAAPTAAPTTEKAPLVVMATEEGEMLPPMSAPPVTATPSPSTGPAVPPVITPTQEPTALPPFSVSLEAEAVAAGLRPNTQLDANPDCYPNGPDVVSRIGNWGQSNPGTITFTVTVPDAGAYAMTVHYVNTSEMRTAEVLVNGAAALSPWPTFPNTESPPTCVDARAPIPVTLEQGSNTIRFGNPGARAPTIDKIVISRP